MTATAGLVILLLVLAAIGEQVPAASADEPARVSPPAAPGPAMMDAYLKGLAFAALDRREAEYEAAKTPEQLAEFTRKRRAFFLQQLGPFPERTPLNARTVGAAQRDGYRIEKVIYESRPGFAVTATLYLPAAPPPFPGVLLPCGHSENGKAAPEYQRAAILMAKNGLAVLCFDPVGQGERKQALDANGKARFGPTAEHGAAAPSCNLLGRNVASVEIWDGMRSIDYLQSRPEIDPARIGCAGNSGGGTQTAYFMALDDRIACAAPNCYLTNFRRLLETIGPQDAEQNLHAQLAFGLDQPDYVLLRAPKPTLIAAVTRDFFDIGGTWQTFRQAKRFYGRLGFPERVELVEDDSTHGFTRLLREATTRWMRRWLLGRDDPVTEPDFPVLTDAELQCTPRGQVLFLPGARSLFDLNREEETGLAGQRQERFEEDPAGALAAARRLAGVRPLAELGPPPPEKTGSSERDGYRIDTLLLPVEPGLRLPALAFVPPDPGAAAYLYLHGGGKQADAAPGGPIEQLVKAGHLVLAVDLCGLGEFQGRNNQGEAAGTSGRDVATAYLLGRSYVGMRAEEILRCARLLASWDPGKPGNGQTTAVRKVHLVAVGEAAPPALHAAAFEPARFASVKIVRCLRSWVPLVGGPAPGQQVNVLHGALTTYDLPDLFNSLPAEKRMGFDGYDVTR